MSLIEVNYAAVLVAAIISMIIGGFWYSPILFGKAWMKLSGISEEQMKEGKKRMGKAYVVTFITLLIMAYVLSHIVYAFGAATISGGLQAGFWVWLGFIATTMLGPVLWMGKPVKLYILDTGHYLVAALLMGAILALWQ